jgi:hypothetical protein
MSPQNPVKKTSFFTGSLSLNFGTYSEQKRATFQQKGAKSRPMFLQRSKYPAKVLMDLGFGSQDRRITYLV